jgi:hypothetical protein
VPTTSIYNGSLNEGAILQEPLAAMHEGRRYVTRRRPVQRSANTAVP